MIQKILLIASWIVGLTVFAVSFFFPSQNEFSLSQSNEEKIFKKASFTKLTKKLQKIYWSSMLFFFLLLFLYNQHF